jgi:hypothetical protein
MTQCQFPIFCCFCVSEKLHWKYSQNWTKQKPMFLFFSKRDGVQRWDGGEPGGGHATPWHGPPLGHTRGRCGPLVHNLTPPSAYIFPSTGKPEHPDQFSSKHTASHRRRREIGRVQKLFSAPCRRGESPLEAFFITMPASRVMRE